MRVLLNFLPLLGRGGGRQNALNLWAAIGRHGGAGHQWLAVTRANLGLPEPGTGSAMDVVTLDVEGAGVGGGRFRGENLHLPRLARRFGADVIFTPMGTGPLGSLIPRIPRVVGWHDGTALYPDSPMWAGHPARELVPQRLRVGYAALALRGVSRVCVQTPTMGRRVTAVLGVPAERIRIVPNGLSAFLAPEAPAPDVPSVPRRILVVTTTMAAKNLPAIPRVARALAAAGVGDAEIVVTLSPEDGAQSMGLAAPAAAMGDGGTVGGAGVVQGGPVPVRCVGPVPHGDLGAFYRGGAAVLVPSWVESFTAVYPEAWHFGLPVVTSDLDFARDLCGEAALYAPPERPSAFAAPLARVLEDVGLRDTLRRAGRARLALLPDWDQRFALYLAALEEAVAIA